MRLLFRAADAAAALPWLSRALLPEELRNVLEGFHFVTRSTALHRAAFNGHLLAVTMLLDAKVPLHSGVWVV